MYILGEDFQFDNECCEGRCLAFHGKECGGWSYDFTYWVTGLHCSISDDFDEHDKAQYGICGKNLSKSHS